MDFGGAGNQLGFVTFHVILCPMPGFRDEVKEAKNGEGKRYCHFLPTVTNRLEPDRQLFLL